MDGYGTNNANCFLILKDNTLIFFFIDYIRYIITAEKKGNKI